VSGRIHDLTLLVLRKAMLHFTTTEVLENLKATPEMRGLSAKLEARRARNSTLTINSDWKRPRDKSNNTLSRPRTLDGLNKE
jgi:hypothetical protein